MIPAIIDGALGAGRSWETLTMIPGRRPLAALATALGDPTLAARFLDDPENMPRELQKRAGEKSMLLFVDQMEELVTVADPEEAGAFDAGLARISEGVPGVRLVTTVRADFLSRIAALPRLGRELSRLLYFLSPLPPERIRDVITGPANATSVTFESEEMIGTLVEATAHAGSGGLPLLSFALAELWEARDRDKGIIPQSALDTMGGVAGALARHGDNVLAGMPAADRVHARRVLLRLVTSVGTRVRRTEAELSVGEGTRIALDALVKGRLLVVHDGEEGATFELAHEVLVNGWGTLREWLDADAEDRARRERVAAAAADWNRAGRRGDMTFRGQRLTEARALDVATLTELERDFIVASLRASQRRLWLGRAMIAGVLVSLVAVYAIQRHIAQNRLADAVAVEVSAAREILTHARTADRNQRELATGAFAKFDAGETEAGEQIWKQVLGERITAENNFRAAASRIETALAKDPTREDVRSVLGDIIFERAVLADALHDFDRRDDLLARLAAYDPEGARRARWARPGHLIVRAQGATIGMERDGVRLGLGGESLADLPLPAGLYTVILEAAGRETVRAPIVIARDETLELDLAMPKQGAVPAGFVYIPPGRFLYGSTALETYRTDFYNAVPIHRRQQPGFMIAKSEISVADWLAFVDAQPADKRASLVPAIDAGSSGALTIGNDGTTWHILLQTPNGGRYTARWGEPIVYKGRTRRTVQDWRRFPITGITPEGEFHAYNVKFASHFVRASD